MDKGAKDKLAGSPGENGGGQDAQKDLHSRTGRAETDRKTQERIERSGKRSSSAGSEKMERLGDRQGQMERYCSTGQSPHRAVAPMEEEKGGGEGEGGGGGEEDHLTLFLTSLLCPLFVVLSLSFFILVCFQTNIQTARNEDVMLRVKEQRNYPT